jgi:hypothetical protein
MAPPYLVKETAVAQPFEATPPTVGQVVAEVAPMVGEATQPQPLIMLPKPVTVALEDLTALELVAIFNMLVAVEVLVEMPETMVVAALVAEALPLIPAPQIPAVEVAQGLALLAVVE